MKQDDEKPYITHSHDVKVDNDYTLWLNDLGSRYQQAKTRATLKVNSEKLLWNWQTGRDLVMRKAEEKWGSGIVEQLSLDLQNRFPGEKGFGASNIWYMKKWYLFYSEKLYQAGEENSQKLHQLGGELLEHDSVNVTKLHQLGAEIKEEDSNQMASFSLPSSLLFLGGTM